MRHLWLGAALPGLLVAGCSRTDNEPGPGGVTVSEAKALDDAAEMLESRDSMSAADKKAETGKAAQ
ncbi:MAG: hypothetical protein C0520_06960, partial [Sphingopyxis sp.]|nr:hypothetical protein [Sphingopyxis sp.]